MKVTAYGAAGCVTGSCFLVENEKRVLVDCGLFQGGKAMDALNWEPWPFDPASLQAVLLTHAHIDHSGRLPKLVKDGFRGPIYTTAPTAALSRILLLDSAHIQEMEAEWKTRKNLRKGRTPVSPLYTTEDAEKTMTLFQPVSQDEVLSLSETVHFRFRNAGHILGASLLELWRGDLNHGLKIVFSGDIGRKDQLIVKDPQPIFDADVLFIESTYGNRRHRNYEESVAELAEAIRYSHEHGQKVLIPAFAVERTQEILYVLGQLYREGTIPRLPVYLDSPLAIAATEIFRQMVHEFDEETQEILRQGHDPFNFPELVFSRTAQESQALNELKGPAVIIAGNGMCTAGRILHHLKHNLWRRGCSLVIVGYQAEGSLGRRIIEGAKSVRIFGEDIMVRARVFTIGGFSAHADQEELLQWLAHFTNPKLQVVVIHGEKKIATTFAETVRRRLSLETTVPELRQTLYFDEAEKPTAVPAMVRPRWDEVLAAVEARVAQARRGVDLWAERLDADASEELEAAVRVFVRTLERYTGKA
ncbi:MBL fold metallo-hydrolase RNA specificity domain-containing protein [Desulfosoma caldarium]|uniref:Metallo-beta-lactamase family protein n=1 Tax=Desulfosoma caldarium TaxID=610254 RepID=A0A3N1VLD6_9BACT|nr:MBL fold metallo-hydrolase [Desulfosoma caldarium]ROR01771.1 metallo-beta-lactamase family protein [Desulfosoma caldarium]